jgi:transcriptional regulator with XRE-family HTH domain
MQLDEELDIVITNVIPDKINEHIKKYGSTKAFIAKRAGMSRQSLSSAMNNNNPTLETLIRVSLALNCPVSELYTYKYYTKDDITF